VTEIEPTRTAPIKQRILRWFLGRHYNPPSQLRSPEAASITTRGVFFGGQYIHPAYLDAHYFVCGSTGSGKTWTLRMLMKSTLFDAQGRLRARALVYDPKNELLPLLPKLGVPEDSIHVLDPFHQRSVRWNMAADINTPAAAAHFSTILFPEEGDKNRFFLEAARGLLRGVLLSFIHRGITDWTLFHVLKALDLKADLLRDLLNAGPAESQALAIRFVQDKSKTTTDILATVTTITAPYRVVANLWQQAKETVSLEQWVKGETAPILVLSTREHARTPIDAINRVVVKRISEYFVDLPDASPSDAETWFFLDELREAGKLDGLSTLLTRSRSKGGHIVLAFQDINGLRLVYGQDGADELANHCGNKVGLRVNDPTTGNWLAARMGKFEEWMPAFSDGETTDAEGKTSRSYSRNVSLQERFFMPGYEFMNFSLTTPHSGLFGVYSVPGAAAPWATNIPPDVVSRLGGGEAGAPHKYPTRPGSEQWDAELTRIDRRILGLAHVANGGHSAFRRPMLDCDGETS